MSRLKVTAKTTGRKRGGASIPCPHCHSVPTKVLQTRRNEDLTVRRERKCLHCHRTFDTAEQVRTRQAA